MFLIKWSFDVYEEEIKDGKIDYLQFNNVKF